MARPSWIARLFENPPTPGPRIVSVDMIPARRASFDWTVLNQNLPKVREIKERVELGMVAGRMLTAEIYLPNAPGPHGVLLYIHGGAWCTLSPAHVRKSAMRLGADRLAVVNLDYSLAPERPFPHAAQEAIYAARWITANAGKYGWDPKRLVIGGDSAGANLSAGTAAFLTGTKAVTPIDEGDLRGTHVDIAALLLLYGVYDFQKRMSERNTTPGTTEIMSNLAYLGTTFLEFHGNPLVSPIKAATLDKFPPTYLCCGSWDSTLPQSLAMCQALADLDVPVTLSVVPGMDHEFLLAADKDAPAEQEFQQILRWLRSVVP